jgi:hypothetical protein
MLDFKPFCVYVFAVFFFGWGFSENYTAFIFKVN